MDWRKRHGRRGRVNSLTLLMGAAAIFCGVMVYVFLPAWIGLHTVHEMVRAAGLQWYAHEIKEAAEDELYYRLEKEGFSYIDPDDCEIYAEDENRVVSCTWEYYGYYPLELGYGHLHFSSTAVIDTTGGVEQTGGLGRAKWFNKL